MARIAELEHKSAAQAAVIRTYQRARIQLTVMGQPLFDNDLLTTLLGVQLTGEDSADLLDSMNSSLGVVVKFGPERFVTFAEADEQVL